VTLPGLPVTAGDKSLVDRVARLELAIRNMQKAPGQVPVTTDYHLYGDKVSSGARLTAVPNNFGNPGTTGQLHRQFIGALPTDMVFTNASFFVNTANAGTAQIGVYTGSAFTGMTLAASGTPTLANNTVATITFPSLSVPRTTLVAVCLLFNVGSSSLSVGGLNSGGNCLGLVNTSNGGGCAKYNTTGLSSFPATLDFTAGWTSLTSSLWVALA
jgi:hypothetical protein